MNKKMFPLILVITGAALLLGAGIFILDSLTTTAPVGLGKWIFDILALLLGAGASIKGWMDVFKKDKGVVGKMQNNIGDNNTNIQAETVNVYPPAPKEYESRSALGSIPPFSADTYVHRGKIEEDVRTALRKGGASAIVGLHAPGGTGKTELAARIAQEVIDGRFGFENVLWVDVNEKTPQEVLNEGLRKCGIQMQPNASEADKKAEWHSFLLNHKLLVIFDDVRANAAHGLKEILPPAPCSALITSRIQQLAGIKEFALDHMEPEQARELFVNSLGEQAVKAEEETVYKLAERCKHNPLALEIASRRIRQNKDFSNPIAKYSEKAEKHFEELKMHGDDRWNMTGVFDLSYNDLNETDQGYFRALAVFAPTGFAPNAVAHLWSVNEDQVSDVLSRLQNLSLVIPVKGDIERFRLHDLLDEYATIKLNKGGKEEREIRSKLADWLADFYNNFYVPDIKNLSAGLLEKDNLLNTCSYMRGYKDADRLARLTTRTLNWFNVHFVESKSVWLAWLEASLKLGIENNQLKANVLQAIGDVQQFRDDRDAAIESYNEALKLFRQVGAKLGEANIISSQGQMYLPDNLDKANEFLNQALRIYQEIGSQYSIPAQIGNYGWELYRLGELEKAKPYLLRAADLFEKMGLIDYAERHRNAVK